MNKPILVEKYADNGQFSHWALIQEETGELLWSEAPEEEMQQVKNCSIPVVSNWVAVKDALPDNCDQVFVKYENGKYGINEWWESDNCWKYEFDNMIVKDWCKPPCY